MSGLAEALIGPQHCVDASPAEVEEAAPRTLWPQMRDRLDGPVYGGVLHFATGDIHAKVAGLSPPVASSLPIMIDRTPSDMMASNVNRPLTTLLAAALTVLLDMGLGVREGSELRDKLDDALASMKADGALNTLILKWVGEDASTFR